MANAKIQMSPAFQHLGVGSNPAEGIPASGGFPRIVFKGKVWKLVLDGEIYSFVRKDDGSPLPWLDVTLLGFNPNISRVYYEDAYQEGNTEAPDCASTDGVHPDAGVPSPQAKACASCRQNVWPGNKKGKPCQEHKRLAVLLMPYMKTKPALPKPVSVPVFLKVPPGSFRPYTSYFNYLRHTGMHWASLITRISFEPDKQFEMKFELKQPLTDKEAPMVLGLMEHETISYITGTGSFLQQLPPPVKTSDEDDVPAETGLGAMLGGADADAAETIVESTVVSLQKQKRKPRAAKPPDPEPVVEEEGDDDDEQPQGAATFAAIGEEDEENGQDSTELDGVLSRLDLKTTRTMNS
jgi:hypothetical protein